MGLSIYYSGKIKDAVSLPLLIKKIPRGLPRGQSKETEGF